MGHLFDRSCKVTVWQQATTTGQGAFVKSDFFRKVGDGVTFVGGEAPLGNRMKFEVKKNLASEPNTCKITIYNLAENTRTALEKTGLAVRLEAGYGGFNRMLFTGDLRYADTTYVAPNFETTLSLADGGRAHAFARVNKSFKPPITKRDLLNYAASTMQLDLPKDVDQSPELADAISTGVTLHGNTRDALTELLAPHGLTWSIQNGTLQILADGEARDGELVLVSGDEEDGTGLIGSPQRVVPDKPGSVMEINWAMMLYPELNPGSLAKIQSKTVNGNSKMLSVVHTGDTRSGDWKSAVKGIPQGGKEPKAKKKKRK